MKNNLIPFIAVVLAMACLISPATAQAKGDDLMELYALAQNKDPAIGRAKARLEVSKADEDIALSLFLPRVDANGGINWIYNTTLNFNSNGDNSGSFTGYSYGVGARVPIFQLSNYFNLKAAKAGYRSSDATLNGVRQELISSLSEAYFGILKAQADERLYQDELKRLSLVHDQAKAFLKSGTGDIIAVYEARARMDGAAADLVKASSQRRVAEQLLASIVGRPVTQVKDLGQFDPNGPEPSDLEWWLDTMQRNQPFLLQTREALSQAEQQRRAVKAGHLPVIQSSGGYSVSKGSTFLPDVETRQWYFGFNVSLPLYSGGETVARTRRALAAESEQRFVLDGAKEQLTQKLKEAFLNLQYSVSLIKSLRQKKSSAELQLKATAKGLSIGNRTVVDLMNAEQSYAVSRRDLTNALYDNALRRLQLNAAAGILTEADLAGLNSHLVDTTEMESRH